MSDLTASEDDNMLMTFLVGHSEEKVTENKFLLLSSQSKVFESMIYGDLRESGPVTIPDIEIDAFQTMLKFINGEKVTFLNMDHAARVCYAAEKYELQKLKLECAKYIYPCTTDDIWTALECGAMFNIDFLKNAALMLVRQNTYRVLASKQFLTLSRPALKAIAQDDFLDIKSEVELFNAIMSWTKHQCFNKGKSYGCKNYRDELGDVIQDIRFMTMTQSDRINCGKLVLTSDEMKMLLGYDKEESDLQLVGSNSSTKKRKKVEIKLEPKSLNCSTKSRKKMEIKSPTEAVIRIAKFNKGQEKHIVSCHDINSQPITPATSSSSSFYLYSIIIPTRTSLYENSDSMYFEEVIIELKKKGGQNIATGKFTGRVEYDLEVRIPLFTEDGCFPKLLSYKNSLTSYQNSLTIDNSYRNTNTSTTCTTYILSIRFPIEENYYYPLRMCKFSSVFPNMADAVSYVIGMEYSC